MAALRDKHLSELHALAGKAGIPRFRLLRRPELVAALREQGVEDSDEPRERERTATGRRSEEKRAPRRRRGRDENREQGADDAGGAEDAEPVTGILDVMPQRYGFLRLSGLEAGEGDVYISASQIRRCELRSGDEISGPARPPRRGERHRALVHVDSVNGDAPDPEQRSGFDELTPVPPTRRLALAPGDGEEAILARAVDLLCPLAYGQRVLVSAAPRSGRTTLLRGLAAAVEAAEGPELTLLLVDERPEEATGWRKRFPAARLAIATADMSAAEQMRVAELALERARRLVESGRDTVLLVDSLSRLGGGGGDIDAAKRLFASGRETEEEGAGSLTVVATVLGEDDIAAAVATTENSLVALDPELAAAGVVPALDVPRCRVSAEEELRDPGEIEGARRLRGLLSELDPTEAARLLREKLEGSTTNAEVLTSS